jgi:hypothetical protein
MVHPDPITELGQRIAREFQPEKLTPF